MIRSVWQMPAAATRTTTSSARGSPSSTSWSAKLAPFSSTTAAVIFTAATLPQAQQPSRVLLQDQRPHLGLDLQALEIRQPAVGLDQRVIRAEEHAILQERVRVPHKLRREVLRRPARE